MLLKYWVFNSLEECYFVNLYAVHYYASLNCWCQVHFLSTWVDAKQECLWPVNILQLHCLQYLIHELVSGGSPKQSGGFFTGNDIDIPVGDMRQLENFFNRLAFFPHILDYRGIALVLKRSVIFSVMLILCDGFLILWVMTNGILYLLLQLHWRTWQI